MITPKQYELLKRAMFAHKYKIEAIYTSEEDIQEARVLHSLKYVIATQMDYIITQEGIKYLIEYEHNWTVA